MSSQNGAADYEGEVTQPAAPPTAAPTFTEVRVAVSRKIETPNGERSVALALSAQPAPGQPAAPLLDQLHRGLSARLDHYMQQETDS
jgi:hypothetical protein